MRRFWATRTGPVAACVVLAMLVLALMAPLVAGDPFDGGGDALLPPLSAGHALGTDDLGRDVWAQLAYGARVSMLVGVVTAAIGLCIGIAVGAAAGFLGGWADAVLMRVGEFFQTLPRFVLALIAVALFGPGLERVILVIAILSWPQTARVVRSLFASLRHAGYVEAARIGGMSGLRVAVVEILPNVLAPVIVLGSLDVATAILLEAGLGFFGLGDPDRVSWGTMLNGAQQYLRTAWWMAAFPGLAIAVTVLGFNMLGDALNQALDPRGRGA
jgi:peptide/nickel transport system permease protein